MQAALCKNKILKNNSEQPLRKKIENLDFYEDTRSSKETNSGSKLAVIM